jgi:hypothetical protein
MKYVFARILCLVMLLLLPATARAQPSAQPSMDWPAPGPEICDGIDNDQDWRIDEDFDLESDPKNCGACGVSCRKNQHCMGGVCVYHDAMSCGESELRCPDAHFCTIAGTCAPEMCWAPPEMIRKEKPEKKDTPAASWFSRPWVGDFLITMVFVFALILAFMFFGITSLWRLERERTSELFQENISLKKELELLKRRRP